MGNNCWCSQRPADAASDVEKDLTDCAGNSDWAAIANAKAISIGDKVEVRNNGDDGWVVGIVTSVAPLKVKKVDGTSSEQWHDARSLDGRPLVSGSGGKSAGEERKGTLDVHTPGVSVFIVDNPGRLEEYYDIDNKQLGQGSYGSVSKATHRKTQSVRAVKSIVKTRKEEMVVTAREISIMKVLDHPNIIKLYENFEDHRNIYLVMELCSGGELFDRIADADHFTEVQAAVVMQQIFKAIHYMHLSLIAHRDLKPENFLLQRAGPIENCIIKVIDFGLSTRFHTGQILTTKAGTPYYVAPEVLAGKYDQLCDTWSCGVIQFVLLCGYPPFWGDSDSAVLQKVRKAKFSFDDDDWKYISEDAKNLIRELLKLDVKERYTAEKTLDHPWIKEHAPKAKDIPLQGRQLVNLRTFRNQNKFKKVALNVIAQQLQEDQIKGLRDLFLSLDKNGDGCLTLEELKTGIGRSGLKEIPPDLQEIMKGIDADGSGQVDYTEFLAATMDSKMHQQEDLCWSAFRVFDRDASGAISREELKQVLVDPNVQEALGHAVVEDVMRECDSNGDDQIDFEEFMKMMRDRTNTVQLEKLVS